MALFTPALLLPGKPPIPIPSHMWPGSTGPYVSAEWSFPQGILPELPEEVEGWPFLRAFQRDPSCCSGSNQQSLGGCLYLLHRTGSFTSAEAAAGPATDVSLHLVCCFAYTHTKIALTVVISCLSLPLVLVVSEFPLTLP